MNHKTMCATLAVAATVLASPGGAQVPPSAGRIVATITTRSDAGTVFCTIYDHAEGYPTRSAMALLRTRVRPVGHVAQCAFDVPAGTYAIAAYHDENGNGRLDTGLFGIPTEGMAASNGARGSFGPPSFAAARFPYRGGGVGTVQMTMVY